MFLACKEEVERISIPFPKKEKQQATNKEKKPLKKVILNETPLPTFIPLKKLPKSRLTESKTFHWFDTSYFIPVIPVQKRKIVGMPLLYVHNYAFDTIINNCHMRLIEHRLSKTKNVDALLLADVNRLIDFLVDKSEFFNRRFPSDTIQELNDMTYFSDIEEVSGKRIKYRFIYSYFAGGGSSLKGNLLKLISKQDFGNIVKLPLSSDDFFNKVYDFPDVED